MNSFAELIINNNINNRNNTAIIDQNGKRKTSWNVLFNQIQNVKNYVLSKNIKGVIPIYMDRCEEYVATILGLNLAGVGVAPLSLSTPEKRKELIEKETKNKSWIKDDFYKAMDFNSSKTFENVIDKWDYPAYVVFTSGTTGVPKGVMLSNSCIEHSIIRSAGKDFFEYEKDDIALNIASFSFIALTLTIFAPLYANCKVHIVEEKNSIDVNFLNEYINKNKITKMFMPPQMHKALTIGNNMKLICIGSDRVTSAEHGNYKLINVYGMSEMAGIALHYEIKGDEKVIPIGKAHSDFKTYILDEQGKEAKEGELCVGGQIAEGYLNNLELSNKLFIKNPFDNSPDYKILMHTGDIVRLLDDGNIEYIDRKDNMIKINGQRIELEEIESQIIKIDNIEDAVVKGFKDENGKTTICAYYVLKNKSQKISDDEIINILEKTLPHYMIPTYYVELDKIPLNANGKVDKKQLVLPNISSYKSEYANPTNKLEKILCDAYEKILKVEKIGINDDFFYLGGDSINVMDLVNYVNNTKEVNLNTIQVYKGRTPKNIALLCNEDNSDVYNNIDQNTMVMELTDSQMGVYLDNIINPNSVKYNISLHYIIKNKFKISKEDIKEKVDKIINNHPSLYAYISQENNKIYLNKNDFPQKGICEIIDNSSFDENYVNSFIKPFDITKPPLCRAQATLTNDNIHILFDMHHIVSDGTSINIITNEIKSIFNNENIESEKIDSFSLKSIEDKIKTNEEIEEETKYYDNLLSDAEIDSNLTFDKRQENNNVKLINNYKYKLNTEKLNDFLVKEKITEHSFFMSVFAYALAKMTNQNASLFTTVESGRKTPLLNKTVSMMVKTLPMYVKLNEEQSSIDFIKQVQTQLINNVTNDVLSFADINRKYGVNNDVSFVFQNELISNTNSEDFTLEVLEPKEAVSNINAQILKENNEYIFSINYLKESYNESSIESFAKFYELLVKAFINNEVLKEINLLLDEEKNLLNKFNDNIIEYNENETVIDVFKKAVEECPQKTVIVCNDEKFTYKEVDEISDKIATYISSLGIKDNDTVSILLPRCAYSFVCAIAVMKTGALYEPLDASYPEDRLSFMCEDASSKLLITTKELVKLLPNYKATILYDDEIKNLKETKYNIPKIDVNNPYIILYTSGTTGKPKGCLLKHSNLISLMHNQKETAQMDEHTKVASYASFGFDAHMIDYYPFLLAKGELHIVDEKIRLDIQAIKDYCEKNQITHLCMTTQVSYTFTKLFDEVKGLKVLSCGGEKLISFEPSKNYKFINYYGPTECTVYITHFEVDKFYENIPIGKVNPNNKIYIVDSYGRRLPIKALGEMIVSGTQVSIGYLNREDRTKEVYVPNTFEKDVTGPYMNCYKTGDIVRILEDGNVEYVGRRDMQVKIRGFRIELAEVEKVIREYPDIKDATVVVRDEASGGKCLHAYIVSDKQIDINDLKKFIKSKKPAYMVPAAIMQIDEIPLTVNSKVDKRKLPPIDTTSTNQTSSTNSIQRENNLLEKMICDILKEILGKTDIDVNAELQDLGITSITSISLAVQLYKKFGVHIEAKDILDEGTVVSLENKILEELLNKEYAQVDTKTKQAAIEEMKTYPLTQTQMGIYIDCMRVGKEAYNVPLLFKIPKTIDINKLKIAINKAVHAHKSMLCSIQNNENGDVFANTKEIKNVDITEETVELFPPVNTTFEFNDNLLFKFRIVCYNNEKYLFFEAHHIIIDGESIGILFNDINKAYNEENIEEETFTACDLSIEEHSKREKDEYNVAKSYYDSIFKGLSNDYSLCKDLELDKSFGKQEENILDNINAVKTHCQKHSITENVFFTSAFAIMLSKWTYHDDALFTTIYNGRNDPRTNNLVSMLVKTLPVYVNLESNLDLNTLYKNVNEHLTLLKKNEIFSFADAAKEYGLNSDIMFIYQGKLLSNFTLGKENIEPIEQKLTESKAEISVEVFETNNGYKVNVEYNAGHYSSELINSLINSYKTVVESLFTINNINEAKILSEEEFSLFNDFNDTYWDVEYRPAYRILQDVSKKYPDKKAVVDEFTSITYKQLNSMSNKFAKTLLDANIEKGSVVEVMTGRTKEVYVGEQGILKMGSAFLFVSPAYPDDRISFITSDANAKAIVTTHAIYNERKGLFNELKIPVFYLDDIDVNVECDNLDLDVKPEDLAYVIYTSGSTGKPKGVKLTNKNLLNFADENPKNHEVNAFTSNSEVVGTILAFTFDASLFDEFSAFSRGKTLCIASEEEIHNSLAFADFCNRNSVTSFCATPSFLINTLEVPECCEAIKNMKNVGAGGEAFTESLYNKLNQINPSLRILNFYGPTEATISCSGTVLVSGKDINIGKPLTNTKIYCVDKQNNVLPKGAMGELVILGDGVGKGYINRDEKTKEVFVDLLGEPCYKSGDLAVINHLDKIIYHGRIDNQVKLRGLRIELGEIEKAIESVENVKKAVVLVKGESSNQYLVAYYTADVEVSKETIIENISKTLTEYMVPKVYMQLDELPLTAHGKVDTKSLPEIKVETKSVEYVAPSTESEKELCEIFEKVLGIEKIGINDDFFELGGTSLSATKVAMLAKNQNIDIVYGDIFKYPTVKSLASLVSNDNTTEKKSQNEKELKIDFTNANKVLENNMWRIGDNVTKNKIGNVILSGPTGFLGMHVLKYLLDNEDKEIYCILRKGSFNSVELKLNSMFIYYFETSIEKEIGKRIHCLDGDITNNDFVQNLKKVQFDTFINCAACVKHFAKMEELESINVNAVENIVKLCKENNKKLIHISTISVAGEGINGSPSKEKQMKENELYFDQTLENAYIITKFKAEKLILDAINDGLDAKIMRCGNLMPRYSDGEFQINNLTNGFMRRLHAYYALGVFPYSGLSQRLEFSPIDETAGAIVELAKTNDKYSVFHTNNTHEVLMVDVIRNMNAVGLKIETVEDEYFAKKLNEKMKDVNNNSILGTLISYLNRDHNNERYLIDYTNEFTTNVLNSINYYWNITDDKYLKVALQQLKDIGFFNLSL